MFAKIFRIRFYQNYLGSDVCKKNRIRCLQKYQGSDLCKRIYDQIFAQIFGIRFLHKYLGPHFCKHIYDQICVDFMLTDDNFVRRHCATGGRFLHWLGYKDKNGVALSEVEFLSSHLLAVFVLFCSFCHS